jgi:hypothetical protein
VRCLGCITKEKLDILREADAIFREEISLTDVAAYKIFAAEPGMLCMECDQPVARAACVAAFESFMQAVAAWMEIDAPPPADETPVENDRVAKADEATRRARGEFAAAYRKLAEARNKAIAAGLPIAGAEPLPPE